jgi:exosome complex component RRP43
VRLATMEAAAFKRLYPHEYYAKFISEGARPDGRPLGRARPTSVAVGVAGTAHGSALVKVGRTTVMAAVKLEACEPDPERPDVGFIDVVMEFPPMCSASTRPGRPNDESSFIARRIEDALVDSRAVDLKKLSIKEGLWAWRVCLDIYCLDHDGSVLDAGLMAALAALRDTKVPFVAVDDRGKLTYGGVGEKKKKDEDGGGGGGGANESSVEKGEEGTIEVAAAPVAVTTALYRKQLIVDPNAEEEGLADATVTVVMDQSGRLVGVHKPGGIAEASETALMHCVAACKLHYDARAKAIDTAFA